ncbi:Ent-copalyl diphosphate synthase [Abeliophyllum distichum]|uniref:Ent-copalyl diphosphate synthase n=1 Tax=Abeliophyllum distichum TaxID=126358 RepID=A0ABD1TXP5_9LAMI
METKDEDCLKFINYVVEKFNGGAPAVYPVDLYARLWAVDRLERLGISRFFKTEIKECLDYIYSGQAFESPSPLFNLYRASQVLFPGEKVLEEAREFTYTFLQERLDSNQLLDKWLISKHLPNEIKTGLDIPWYANLPRVEARFYIENYGVDDVWIGKSLYRFPLCPFQYMYGWAWVGLGRFWTEPEPNPKVLVW